MIVASRARNLEDLFIKEFRENVRKQGDKNIHEIPLPKICSNWEVSGTEVDAVKGITKECYNKLNKTVVKRLPKGKEAKRRKIDKVTRGFVKDSSGKFIYEDYKVPVGSVVVTSTKDIGLSYKDYLSTEGGYGYIDFRIINGEKVYMYVLPKEVLYKVNQTALVLTVKSMTCYSGYGYNTWGKGIIFLYVIPYSPSRKYEATLVLKTGHTLDYTKEIKTISDFWEGVNLIPNIALSSLQTGENLCLKNVVINSDKIYNPVEMLPISKKEIFGDEE